MCGIAGFLDSARRAGANEAAETAGRMADALINRGPDDSGSWADGEAGIALAHRRLSILDLSPQGHQPMHSACGRYVIAFNGEIYNFGEIRQELEQAGQIAWRGHSDTEVMLAAIARWGLEDAVRRFAGMFAFALWDRERRTLHLVRDRLGEKPLYYGWAGSTLLFGSELKALRRHPAWRGTVDRNALTLLLRHGYVPAPYSIHEGIFKLMPGSVLSIPMDTPAGAELVPKRYWSALEAAAAGVAAPYTGSEAEAIAQLDCLLRRSVQQQMVADVPLGAFLSGGFDSSTVVALMQAQSSQQVQTFTIGFNEEGYNEAEHAKAVARHLGTDHTELYVTSQEAMDVIPRLATLYDEPFADSSQIPTFLVSQLARRSVTVSLSGDGGDELFAGYNRYFWGRNIWRRVGWIPHRLRGAAAAGLTALSPQTWNRLFDAAGPLLPAGLRQRMPGDKLHKLAEIMDVRTPEEMYLGLVSLWKNPAAIVPGAREPATVMTEPIQGANFPDFVQRMMYLDTVSYLPDDILVKVDRASMGVSLEARVPFLDHRVLEFAWQLPMSMKIRDGKGKWILRQLLGRHVPPQLMERPKMGFGVPLDVWLRGPLRPWAESLLDESRLRAEGYFDPAPIRAKWAEHLSGKRNWQHHLWCVLMFQAWLEQVQPGRNN
jgi:asparagine synthase (glutamine-hydrolysing)